jgi:hypothetical protein
MSNLIVLPKRNPTLPPSVPVHLGQMHAELWAMLEKVPADVYPDLWLRVKVAYGAVGLALERAKSSQGGSGQ